VSPEYGAYQAEYKDLLLRNSTDKAVKKAAENLEMGLQQIYLGNLDRVDRCMNCHLGVENPQMDGAEEPFAQHSGNVLKNHPPEKYGCTICHNGQGRAIDKREAHGVGHDTYWDRPLIPFDYIQSACAACHDFGMLNDKGGQKVALGEKLFRESGCKGCHKLDGAGGVLGKALDGVGSQPVAYFPMRNVEGERTIYAWMKEHFDDPRNIVVDSEMKINLTDEESDFLTTYVLSLRSEEVPRKYRRTSGSGAEMAVADQDVGESLYKMYCIACHATGKISSFDEVFKRTIPAIMNPAFLKTADDTYLKMVISEGRAETQMTAWKSDAAGITDEEMGQIIEYLTRERPAVPPEPFGFAKFKANTKYGEELYKVRCMGCHGERGEGGVGLNLRNPVIQKMADPDFLAITVRDGRKGTHMAAFGKNGVGFANQDIADVIAYVRTLSKKR
jgi:mono/diheme cytochrome c family protein